MNYLEGGQRFLEFVHWVDDKGSQTSTAYILEVGNAKLYLSDANADGWNRDAYVVTRYISHAYAFKTKKDATRALVHAFGSGSEIYPVKISVSVNIEVGE